MGDATESLVDALRQEGAHLLEPVRFHYIEVLARHAGGHDGRVRRMLDAKLADAASVLRQRMVQAQHGDAQSGAATTKPAAPGETLADLVRLMAQHAPQGVGASGEAHAPSRTELKSVGYFRNTWSRLSAEKQVAQALRQVPKNAGPINSQVVALRSLALMRDTSPDYLNRFMSYVDTLLCLDQSDKGTLVAPRPPRAAKPKTKA